MVNLVAAQVTGAKPGRGMEEPVCRRSVANTWSYVTKKGIHLRDARGLGNDLTALDERWAEILLDI